MGVRHLHGIPLGRNIQVLDGFEDVVFDLIVGIAIDDRKPRLFPILSFNSYSATYRGTSLTARYTPMNRTAR